MEKKRWLKLKSVFILLLFFMVACTQDQSTSDMQQQDMASENMATEDTATEEVRQPEGDVGLEIGEKVIENAYLSYETTNFDETVAFVNQQVEAYEGTLQHSQRGQSSTSYEFVGDFISMTIRIPQNQLHPFIETIDQYSDLYILSQEVGRTDVTQNYRDNETRIAVLREEEEALRALLQEQASVEEILQVRRRLSEVISEREIFEDQNRAYDEQTTYSTVELSIQQTDRASGRDVSGFWNRLSNAFVDSFYSFISFMQNFIIRLIYFIPHLIILAVLSYIIYRFVKSRKDKE